MACRDWDTVPDTSQLDAIRAALNDAEKAIHMLEAMTCASLEALKEQMGGVAWKRVYPAINFKEAGVTIDELSAWHTAHLAKDEARRAKEAREAREHLEAMEKNNKLMQLQASARAKLTDEEYKALTGG